MATKSRKYEFDVAVDRDASATSGRGGSTIPREEAWWAEHLVLAGLVRCTLASLAHAAQRAGVEVVAEGRARGTVTKRDADGLYAFVEIDSSYDIELSPEPELKLVTEILDRAERGCFVGNSLTTRPRYRWTVNGEVVR
jgi:uncharacterized OsmC-like protein